MSDFREHYKLTGAAFDAAEALHMERKKAIEVCSEFAEEFGGIGISAARNGDAHLIAFDAGKLPDGWRKVRHLNEGAVGGIPKKNTKEGKALFARMEGLPKVHDYIEAVRRIAPDVANATTFGSSTIRFSTCSRLALPAVSYVLSVPRTLEDGLSVPPDFVPITAREYEQAFHDHNEAVRSAKEAAA